MILFKFTCGLYSWIFYENNCGGDFIYGIKMVEEYIPILFLKIPYGFSILSTTPDNENYLTLFPFNATWKIT